jgi:hypothetical protein
MGQLEHWHHHYGVVTPATPLPVNDEILNDLRSAPPNLKIGRQTWLGPERRPTGLRWAMVITGSGPRCFPHTLASRLRSTTNSHLSPPFQPSTCQIFTLCRALVKVSCKSHFSQTRATFRTPTQLPLLHHHPPPRSLHYIDNRNTIF